MSAYIAHLVRLERKAAVADEARPNAETLIAWNDHRAQVERQIGRNQVAAGNDAGQMRIERAKMHEETAKLLRDLLA